MLEPLLRDPNLAETVIYLCKTFSERSALLGEKDGVETQVQLARVWKTHFADIQDEMYLWLFASIKLSMSSLFRGARNIGEVLQATQKKAAPQSQSPNPAANFGQSGA